jgi:hypothetical protein
VPADFLFSFKVTDEITTRRFPKLPRFGERAGQQNLPGSRTTPDLLGALRIN